MLQNALCHMKKLVLGFPTRSDTNRAVEPQTNARCLKSDLRSRGTVLCSKNKGADQLAATAQLFCTFVFIYAKSMLAAPVAVRSLYFSALNHSIISPLCLV